MENRLTMKDRCSIIIMNLNLCFSSRPSIKDFRCHARIKILGHRRLCRGLLTVTSIGFIPVHKQPLFVTVNALMQNVWRAFSKGVRE